MPSVAISARGEERVRTGHPWIYRSDVTDVDAAAGDIVQVIGPRKRTIGYALFSDQSLIPIRMLSRGEASDVPCASGFSGRARAESSRPGSRIPAAPPNHASSCSWSTRTVSR